MSSSTSISVFGLLNKLKSLKKTFKNSKDDTTEAEISELIRFIAEPRVKPNPMDLLTPPSELQSPTYPNPLLLYTFRLQQPITSLFSYPISLAPDPASVLSILSGELYNDNNMTSSSTTTTHIRGNISRSMPVIDKSSLLSSTFPFPYGSTLIPSSSYFSNTCAFAYILLRNISTDLYINLEEYLNYRSIMATYTANKQNAPLLPSKLLSTLPMVGTVHDNQIYGNQINATPSIVPPRPGALINPNQGHLMTASSSSYSSSSTPQPTTQNAIQGSSAQPRPLYVTQAVPYGTAAPLPINTSSSAPPAGASANTTTGGVIQPSSSSSSTLAPSFSFRDTTDWILDISSCTITTLYSQPLSSFTTTPPEMSQQWAVHKPTIQVTTLPHSTGTVSAGSSVVSPTQQRSSFLRLVRPRPTSLHAAIEQNRPTSSIVRWGVHDLRTLLEHPSIRVLLDADVGYCDPIFGWPCSQPAYPKVGLGYEPPICFHTSISHTINIYDSKTGQFVHAGVISPQGIVSSKQNQITETKQRKKVSQTQSTVTIPTGVSSDGTGPIVSVVGAPSSLSQESPTAITEPALVRAGSTVLNALSRAFSSTKSNNNATTTNSKDDQEDNSNSKGKKKSKYRSAKKLLESMLESGLVSTQAKTTRADFFLPLWYKQEHVVASIEKQKDEYIYQQAQIEAQKHAEMIARQRPRLTLGYDLSTPQDLMYHNGDGVHSTHQIYNTYGDDGHNHHDDDIHYDNHNNTDDTYHHESEQQVLSEQEKLRILSESDQAPFGNSYSGIMSDIDGEYDSSMTSSMGGPGVGSVLLITPDAPSPGPPHQYSVHPTLAGAKAPSIVANSDHGDTHNIELGPAIRPLPTSSLSRPASSHQNNNSANVATSSKATVADLPSPSASSTNLGPLSPSSRQSQASADLQTSSSPLPMANSTPDQPLSAESTTLLSRLPDLPPGFVPNALNPDSLYLTKSDISLPDLPSLSQIATTHQINTFTDHNAREKNTELLSSSQYMLTKYTTIAPSIAIVRDLMSISYVLNAPVSSHELLRISNDWNCSSVPSSSTTPRTNPLSNQTLAFHSVHDKFATQHQTLPAHALHEHVRHITDPSIPLTPLSISSPTTAIPLADIDHYPDPVYISENALPSSASSALITMPSHEPGSIDMQSPSTPSSVPRSVPRSVRSHRGSISIRPSSVHSPPSSALSPVQGPDAPPSSHYIHYNPLFLNSKGGSESFTILQKSSLPPALSPSSIPTSSTLAANNTSTVPSSSYLGSPHHQAGSLLDDRGVSVNSYLSSITRQGQVHPIGSIPHNSHATPGSLISPPALYTAPSIASSSRSTVIAPALSTVSSHYSSSSISRLNKHSAGKQLNQQQQHASLLSFDLTNDISTLPFTMTSLLPSGSHSSLIPRLSYSLNILSPSLSKPIYSLTMGHPYSLTLLWLPQPPVSPQASLSNSSMVLHSNASPVNQLVVPRSAYHHPPSSHPLMPGSLTSPSSTASLSLLPSLPSPYGPVLVSHSSWYLHYIAKAQLTNTYYSHALSNMLYGQYKLRPSISQYYTDLTSTTSLHKTESFLREPSPSSSFLYDHITKLNRMLSDYSSSPSLLVHNVSLSTMIGDIFPLLQELSQSMSVAVSTNLTYATQLYVADTLRGTIADVNNNDIDRIARYTNRRHHDDEINGGNQRRRRHMKGGGSHHQPSSLDIQNQQSQSQYHHVGSTTAATNTIASSSLLSASLSVPSSASSSTSSSSLPLLPSQSYGGATITPPSTTTTSASLDMIPLGLISHIGSPYQLYNTTIIPSVDLDILNSSTLYYPYTISELDRIVSAIDIIIDYQHTFKYKLIKRCEYIVQVQSTLLAPFIPICCTNLVQMKKSMHANKTQIEQLRHQLSDASETVLQLKDSISEALKLSLSANKINKLSSSLEAARAQREETTRNLERALIYKETLQQSIDAFEIIVEELLGSRGLSQHAMRQQQQQQQSSSSSSSPGASNSYDPSVNHDIYNQTSTGSSSAQTSASAYAAQHNRSFHRCDHVFRSEHIIRVLGHNNAISLAYKLSLCFLLRLEVIRTQSKIAIVNQAIQQLMIRQHDIVSLAWM